MKRSVRHALAIVSAVFLSLQPAIAQDAPAGPPAGGPPGQRGPRGPRPAPTNIKALPKNITGDEVNKVMHQFEGALGVECEYCHAQNPQTKRNDFPSDANPMKNIARLMITMTADLNDKYLTQIPDRHDGDPITCGTCHRGEKKPAVFVPKPEPPRMPPGGAPAAAPPTTK